MAEPVTINGSSETGKVRNPLLVAVWAFLTLGIYAIVWYYKVNKEMAELGKARGTDELGDNPVTSVLAVTLGALVIVPAIVSIINTFKRVQAAQRLTGGGEPINGWLGLILALVFSIALYPYMQSGLNKALQAQAGAPGAVPVPAAA